jgi:murein L,D-transpeptidase YafK
MAARSFRKIRFVVFMVLVLLNVVLAVLYYRAEARNRSMFRLVYETNRQMGQVQEALSQKDLQKAFTHVTEAQKRIVAYLPPPAPAKKPAAKETPRAVAVATTVPAVTTMPATSTAAPPVTASTTPRVLPPPKAVALNIPDGQTPQNLLTAVSGEYLLICEKDNRTLHLFRYTGGKFTLVKSYPCLIGANNKDKKEAGDLATPKGTYFFMRFVPGKNLPEKYGYGAFVMNYPNFLDRKVRKNGTGIWLHGHTPGKSLGQEDLQNTQGCIAVSNEDMKELAGLLKPAGTPITIVDRIALTGVTENAQAARELARTLEGWRLAWESANTKKFMTFYGKEFINGDGMNYEAFRRQKEKVNASKKFIRVKTQDVAILLPPEQNGQIAVVRFIQKYHSNNFDSDSQKLFYLKHGQDGWKIIGESVF